MDKRYEGFFEPKYCPRGRTDCQALAQIIGVAHASFACVGERTPPPAERTDPQDAYRFCHKSVGTPPVDVMMNHDERDLTHIAAVYSWASACTMPSHGEPRVPVLPLPVERNPE